MTTMLEDIGAYMQTNGRGTLGTDLFLNFLPEAPNSVTVLSEYMSETPKDTMGAHLPSVEMPHIQVMVRRSATDYLAARNESDLCYNLLVMVLDLVVGTYLYTITPLDTPTLMSRDDNERPLVVCNYVVYRRNAT